MDIPAGTSPQMMVYQALQWASSQDATQLKQAEAKLAEWETEPGFYTMLHGVFSDHSLDVNVRWMAAVCFKNGVAKYWRKNAKHEISASEKVALRAALLSKFDEPVQQIAVQIAALIAKIARLDCPREWPEIIPTLIEAIQISNQQQQQRSLMVLQHVVKALSTKRLYADRRLFCQLTTTIYTFLLNLWDGFTTLYFQSVHAAQPPATSAEYAEKAILALRILRKLTVYGFAKPHRSEQCMLFVRTIFVRLRESLECRLLVSRAHQQRLVELTEKFVLKQMKILNEFVEQHPLSFVEFIPDALEFGFHFVFNAGASMIFDERNECTFHMFAIHCINLMKGLLTCTAFNKRPSDAAGGSGGNASTLRPGYEELQDADGADATGAKATAEPDVEWALRARKEFFTPVRLNYICEKVIMHYFLLTQQDLETWDDDPEAFASDEGGESWKYALRPCTETFFLALFNQFRVDMTPEMLTYIRKARQMELTADSDLKTILTKDAIYNAAGIASFNLFDEVDFDEWFRGGLADELRIGGMNFRIVRRRVILLVGQWTGSKALRPAVYAACLHLLGDQEDMCVRLAACKTLMTAIDDFEFDEESFLEYLQPSFQLLFALLQATKECDTKMNVLGIMSYIIDRMSEKIQTHADSLIQYLPRLWEESNDHNMLRCAIISTLVHIVKAFGDMPPTLTAFLYPVIGMSTNKDEPSHVYLLEEGLELWLVVVENSATMTPELLELSGNLLTIIEHTSENLRTTLCIIQMYILLNPAAFLYRHGKQLVKSCQYLLSDMRSEGIVMVMKLYEECMRCKPDVALELLRPALPGIVQKVVDNEEYPMVMTSYLAIVARLLIIDQATFGAVLQQVEQQQQQLESGGSSAAATSTTVAATTVAAGGQILEQVLDVWIAKMPLITQPEKRKLLSLALTSLLTTQNNAIYERFGGILFAVCETLNDIMKDEDDSSEWTDSLVYTDGIDDIESGVCFVQDIDRNTHHYDRSRQLCLTDPVHTIALRKFLQTQLDTMSGQLGVERFNGLMSTLVKPVLVNLCDYVRL